MILRVKYYVSNSQHKGNLYNETAKDRIFAN